MSKTSLIKQKKQLKKILEIRNRPKSSEEIRVEELKKSDVGRLLIESEEFKSDGVDLGNLCAEFENCKYLDNGHIRKPRVAYILYWLVCGHDGDGACSGYKKYK